MLRTLSNWNRLRFDPARPRGHVESWFLRVNAPDGRRALWLKATILAPPLGAPQADLWAIAFEADRPPLAARHTVPWGEARFFERPDTITFPTASFELSRAGRLLGEVATPDGPIAFDLRLELPHAATTLPLSLLPFDDLVNLPFPRSSLLTPLPSAHARGAIETPQGAWEVEGWLAMQGHNWGEEHAWAYAWTHAWLLDAQERPAAVVEAFSTRLRIAGRLTPWISSLVVRTSQREHRFDALVDLWRQRATVDPDALRYRLQVVGADGEATLEAQASVEQTACLGYLNPDGRLAYCLNSKLAALRLRLQPHDAPPLELHAPHAALEFLRDTPDPRLPTLA